MLSRAKGDSGWFLYLFIIYSSFLEEDEKQIFSIDLMYQPITILWTPKINEIDVDTSAGWFISAPLHWSLMEVTRTGR